MTMQIGGLAAVNSALDEMESGGGVVSLLLVRKDSESSEVYTMLERAKTLDVEVIEASDNDISRMALGVVPGQKSPEVLALIGRNTSGTLDEVFERGGLVWLLHGITYTGNAGFSIRTAEVSGADAVLIDAEFSHDERRNAERQSVRSHRFLPTVWTSSKEAVDGAKAAGFRIVAVEDVGTVEPWGCDLTGDVLCVVGSEREGIPQWILDEADDIVRLPMAGFVPSYNLQVAVSVVAVEALRQRRA
jgi:TrmH family RNA methyltransferase